MDVLCQGWNCVEFVEYSLKSVSTAVCTLQWPHTPTVPHSNAPQSPSTPNRKALPNGKRPSPLRRKLYYDEAPSVEQDDSTGKDVPDTVGSASRRRKAAPARCV